MKIKPQTLVLKKQEYLITGDSPNTTDYTVFYKGEQIFDVVALVRDSNLEHIEKLIRERRPKDSLNEDEWYDTNIGYRKIYKECDHK